MLIRKLLHQDSLRLRYIRHFLVLNNGIGERTIMNILIWNTDVTIYLPVYLKNLIITKYQVFVPLLTVESLGLISDIMQIFRPRTKIYCYFRPFMTCTLRRKESNISPLLSCWAWLLSNLFTFIIRSPENQYRFVPGQMLWRGRVKERHYFCRYPGCGRVTKTSWTHQRDMLLGRYSLLWNLAANHLSYLYNWKRDYPFERCMDRRTWSP